MTQSAADQINQAGRARTPRRRKAWEPAPPDPGITPNGIRDRALQAGLGRGPRPEDKERTRVSIAHWREYRKLAGA